MKCFGIHIGWLVLGWGIWLAGLMGCQHHTEESDWIARVGQETISAKELQESLILEPQYHVRAPLTRVYQSQLNYLIQRNFQYLAAVESKLNQQPDVRDKLNFIERQELFKAFIKRHFLDTLTVPEAELRRGLTRFREKRRVRQIFAPDESAIRRIQQQMHRHSFDVLFTRLSGVHNDTVHATDLGYVTFGDLEPELEQVIYRLNSGEVSPVVRSSHGYHILQVDSVVTNPAAQYLPPAAVMAQVRDIIKQRRADRNIRAYLKRLAGERRIAVNNRVLKVVEEGILRVMGENYRTNQGIVPPMKDAEIEQIHRGVHQVLDEPLVRFGRRTVTVRELLKRLRQTPPLQRPYLNTRSRLVQAIINFIREDLIVQAARKEGLDGDPQVRQSIHRQQKYFLARQFASRLSGEFRAWHPEEWKRYREVWFRVQEEFPVQVRRDQLFRHIAHPESVMVDPPIPVVLKNRYMW